MGRHKKEIDQKTFESLCGLQCTLEEFCGFLGVSDKTLEKWCKSTYGANFSEVFKEKRSTGKISLRRNQFRLAENNATMAIWLGKQYLGQSDNPVTAVATDEAHEDSLSLSLKNLGKELESDD